MLSRELSLSFFHSNAGETPSTLSDLDDAMIGGEVDCRSAFADVARHADLMADIFTGQVEVRFNVAMIAAGIDAEAGIGRYDHVNGPSAVANVHVPRR